MAWDSGIPCGTLLYLPLKRERKVGASPYAARRGRGWRALFFLGSRVRGNDVGAPGMAWVRGNDVGAPGMAWVRVNDDGARESRGFGGVIVGLAYKRSGIPAEPLCISPWKGERKVGACPCMLRSHVEGSLHNVTNGFVILGSARHSPLPCHSRWTYRPLKRRPVEKGEKRWGRC